MKKSKFGRRVIALVLVFIMVVSMLPLSVFAALNDIATGTAAGDTGIDNSSLGKEGTINWPVKIYDYLADGMLFEYSSNNGTTISGDPSYDYGGGSYAYGKPMPYAALASDYTSDTAYEECAWDGHSTRGTRYKRTRVAAVNDSSPQYMKVTLPRLSNYVSGGSSSYNWNLPLSCLWADGGSTQAKANVRYMVIVYRSSGIYTLTGDENTAGPVDILLNCNGSSENYYRKTVSWTNSSGWTYKVFDLSSIFGTTWTNNISTINETSFTIHTKSTDWSLDLSHVGYFSTSADATEYAENCLEFITDPGEYLPNSAYWNGGNNLGFGMLLPSSGGSWSLGGGTSTANNGYHTYRVGYSPYTTGTGTYSATFNDNRKDVNGNAIGNNNIYFITSTYAKNSNFGYQSKLANDDDPNNDTDYLNGYNTNDLELDGYSLLTYVTQGLMTIGLLEGTLNKDGTPQYRQEAVEYVAQMLYNSLVIPQKDSTGKYNYNYVTGNKSTQYGTDSSGNALDLAQALRNCLGITFTSGANKGAFPASTSTRTYGYGSYAGTLTRANNDIGLKGKFLDVKSNIHTCMDAAYYLLNNIFVADSYNQEQTDYKYLTLSNATLDNGDTAFVFDGGFSTGADPALLEDRTLTQEQYLAQTQSAVEYSSSKSGGDGTISMGTVQAKDKYYYSGSATTTRFPFLPITGATGDYAGETRHYYFAEDGYRSYENEFGTYVNRNYNYVLASNGEFVYHEEDGLFFEFEGDDDVYLFINGQLALDIGGAHSISNVRFDVNDYVNWARAVLQDPSSYSEAEVARAEALDLENGEVASFDFYYMERHGYGANMRIVTNMRITDPKLRVEKTAYQDDKQIEYGGIVDANDPIEYNFKISNIGNTKLYNLTLDDTDIGVTLSPELGLAVAGDGNDTELDDINGYYVTDINKQRLDAKDLTAVVTGYQNVGEGNGDYVQDGHKYTYVGEGKGTHEYYDALTITFDDDDTTVEDEANEALKNFLKTLQSDKTDNETVDDEQTQRGSGLWVDSSVTFKGIYYTMTKEQEEAGMFDNIVKVTSTTRADRNDPASELLRSEARHRVYVTAIPNYYQWAEHDLYISKQRVLDDASAEAGNENSMLHDYIDFFNKVSGDISKFGTKLCDRLGNVVDDSYYKDVCLYGSGDGSWGYKTNYQEPGIYEFHLLFYLYGASGVPSDLSQLKASDMNLGDYAIVRVLIIVADVEDSEYVLDYGLSTENLDAKGELFKNDELYGSMSGTQALLMGVTNKEPSYLNVTDKTNIYNRIDFSPLDLTASNKIQTEDGYYNVNLLIPETGKKINYDEFSKMYTLTETGTTTVNVDCPVAWDELYLYYWYDDGRNNTWPGTKMTQTSHGNFELAIPGNAPHIIINNGNLDNIKQTADLDLTPGQEVWVDLPGTTDSNGNWQATVGYKTADGIVHVSVPEGWGDVYYYCWDAFDHGLVEWPGTKVDTVDKDGFYTFTVPGDITDIVINNGGNGKQTTDQVMYAGSESWIVVNDSVVGTNKEEGVDYYGATVSRCHPDDTVTMHADVPDDWTGAALFYWNSNGSATQVTWPGIPMTKGDDGLYHLEGVPADVTNVIINDGQQAKAKQTHNLTINAGSETWFNVKVKSGKGETKIKAEVPSSWSTVCAYFFKYDTEAQQDVAVGSSWPGTQLTKGTDGTYTCDVPTDATHYIINNGNNGEETQRMLVIRGTTNDILVRDNKDAISKTDTELHIEPPAGWNNVYVHYWYSVNGEDVPAAPWPGVQAEDNEDGTYSFTIPAGYNKFLIHNGAGEQTDNITEYYMGIENHVTIYSDKQDNGHNTYRVGMPYQTDIVYGENAEKEGFTFTPTNFMDSAYSLWLAVTVHENKVDDDDEGTVNQNTATPLGQHINIGKEVQMYKKVTVLPASVVYYEDDFAGIKYNTDTSTNIFSHFGDGSGSLSQEVDQNQEYGNDSTYQGSENDEITGGSLTKLEIKDDKEFASFEFTGTGFEIIGHTHAIESASLMVVVKNEAGKEVVKRVITEFDNGADGGSETIESVPLIRFSNLKYGNYTVSLRGVPVFDWSQWDGDRNHKPPVKKACLCIDGVRIYQPLAGEAITEYGNVALGKTYTATAANDNWKTDLTDGNAPTEIYKNGSEYGYWFGFNRNSNVNTNKEGIITFDMGEKYNMNAFRAHLFVNDTAGLGIGQPAYVTVEVSDDGVNYTKVGNLSIKDGLSNITCWAALNKEAAGRYVRFVVGADDSNKVWTFINEVEIYGVKASKPSYELDPKTRNLALDRTCTPATYTGSPYTAKLTDGKSETTFADANWFGFKNGGKDGEGNIDYSTKSAEFTLSLAYESLVSSVRVHHFAGENSVGAGGFDYMEIYYSVDGASYQLFDTMYPFEKNTAPYWITSDASGDPIVAKDFKFVVYGKKDNSLSLINEIEIYGTEYSSLGRNLAYGQECEVATYTGSPYTAKLTDGRHETNLAESEWFAFKNTGDASTGNINPSNNRAVFVLDLEKESVINYIRFHQFAGSNSVGAGSFEYINVYASTDGTNYPFVESIYPDTSSTSPYWATVDLTSKSLKAKSLKFAVVGASGTLSLINELEVYGTEVLDLGDNLALGQKCEAVAYPDSPYTANLTDGKYETSFEFSEWFGFKNTGDATTGNFNPSNNRSVFVLNLEKEATITSVRLHHFAGTNSDGAGAFGFVNIYYSTDGVNFPFYGTILPTTSSKTPYWATLDFSAKPVNAKYIKIAVGADVGTLCLFNEIEVYGKEVAEPGRNDAYLGTENGASFTEIRNLVAERQAFAVKYNDVDGLSVSGGTNTWIENRNNVDPSNRYKSWKNNTVNSVEDYLLAGPNNEIYMIESTDEEQSALAFYVTENAKMGIHNMQVAMRGIDYGAFVGSENKGSFHAEIQYGAEVDGELVWKSLTTLVGSSEQYYTIPYTECPYDAENDRYQVVLRVADTDVTGMASFTTIKLKGLTLNTLNTSEVPDVPEITYDDELNNTIVDNNGNVVPSGEYANFALLATQMKASTYASTSAVAGVDTSALGVLYDSFTADSSSNFVLTEDSKIFIVTETETKPSAETIETAQLVQTQFMADKRPSANAMEIVWGLEKYAQAGDILIYANASGYDTEEFKIVVTDRAKVYAADDNALLYGLNTLQKHFRKANSNAIKGFTLQDAPDTIERTLHLDVARKYQTVESIKNYIAEISWMGYNAIELHFSEDGGFRMDFWGDTTVPGMTGNDFSWVCGSNPAPWVFTKFQDTTDKGKYLTTEEVIEVCQTAKKYNIEIIPSFDTPAHVGYMTELYYNTVAANSSSPIRNFTYNGTSYTLPTQINYRNYTGSSDSRYDFSVLNLSDTAVKNFAYAMYTDIAAFFKYYAGSTDFNIGADEVALTSSDVWTYNDFINYVNEVNAVLKSKGYRTRMYNDFLYNTNYSDSIEGIDTDIDVVYWLPATSSRTYLRTASFFAEQGRNVYSGVNFWTYYVLRIAPYNSNNTGTHLDARDPANRQWEFYRNQEDYLYNEWNASQFGAYTDTNMGAANNYSGDKLAGAYFMIWNDFAGLNTEVEVWNGCYDEYGKTNSTSTTYTGYGYYYSMIERMWSSGIKQWNADINSTLTFENFETLRDSMGFFPGYVATDSSQAYANGMVLAEPTAVSDTAYRSSHTVTFKNYNGVVLSTQTVRDLTAATPPKNDPTREADVWYTYTFTGWDTDFSSITKDTVVTATYSQTATTAGAVGYLGVTVSGGTNVKVGIGEKAASPQGVEYINPSMELGVKVTLTAETTNSNRFVGWIDAKNGGIVSTSLTYTFYTSGNDIFVALFDRDIEGMNTVTFRNDKTNQILDVQHYSATDTIEFPANTSYPGYEFLGWSYTQEEIQAKLSEGKDVTVIPMWKNAEVYFSVTVKGGTVTDSPELVDGKYVGYKGTTVTANKAPSGKLFAYWSDEDGNILSYEQVYKFYPYKDTVLTANYITTTTLGVEITGTMPEPEEPEEDTTAPEAFTIYFKNNWLWSDVRVHYWNDSDSSVNTSWPGVEMTLLENDGEFDIYTVEIPTNISGFLVSGIKNDGSGNRDQTPNITQFVDGRQYSMTWNNGNQVVTDDSRVTGEVETQYNTVYLQVNSEWASDNAWFAVYAWNPSNTSDVKWYEMTKVNGNVYVTQLPVEHSAFLFARMNPASTTFGWDNVWSQTNDLTVTPDDEKNMYILNSDGGNAGSVGNMNTVFFVNDRQLSNITVTYTDSNGTYETEAVFYEKDENGNDIYSMLIPENAQKVTISDGTNGYVYTVDGTLADRAIFSIVTVQNSVKYDVATSVGMDTTTLADSNTVVFSWEVPDETGYTFINAGLLLVREEDYNKSSFAAGTINPDVIQFVPAKKYLTSSGIHSITMPYVSTGDAWVVCSFVQYRDEQGILRTKYSKQVTGKK